MVGHYQTLVEAVSTNPTQPILALPLLTAAEQHHLLVTWNQTAAPLPGESCIHHLFEAQVERTPEAVAVVCDGACLTYRELNQRANQLAQYLRKHGVGPDVLVGICLERSVQMLVGLLGILKAGGAYVPLDPEYPPERLAFILRDTQIPILLSHAALVRHLPLHQAQVIDLEADWPAMAQESAENVRSGVHGAHLAYVMYTSGSTGQPKGVLVCHRGVYNYLTWRQVAFPLHATDRVLQKTSFGFVDSVWEFFEPLMVGAQLYMARPGGHQDPAYLVRCMAEQHITAADFIPSLLHMVLDEPGVEQCRHLRRVTTGSEVVSPELQERCFARLEAHLYNLYGPTEASIASTCWPCQRDATQHTVPIGRPIANTQIYLLDTSLQLVPVGVPGELYIGGSGLARGYLNSPDLTAEKFLPHPFSDKPGERLYKTGDLARYLPDGTLDFLGRVDHQVKVRGYRIEPGEIEAMLSQHPTVREAVVVVREEHPGDKRLVAYVVPAPEQSPLPSTLRHFLTQKLPAYMIPAAFVRLDAMPLTPNGKVNRQALPAPQYTRIELEGPFVAPRTHAETQVAAIWTEILKLDRVGVYDNFFALGGHSLLATQVVSRLRLAFPHVELPLRLLFEMPTVAGLALAIVQHQAGAIQPADLGDLIAELEGLSADDVQQRLADQRTLST
jgi:amino acid adenylation domain-containing protein